jgi:hypothetical protein
MNEAADTEQLPAGDVLVETTPVRHVNGLSNITVTIHNESNGFLAEPVVFYDGDPAAGGQVFEVQQIPYVRKGDTYVMHTHLRPQSEGQHNIYVRVGTPGSGASTTVLTSLNVP